MAFALGATLRAIPEILAGPYLVGNDTVFYAGEIARTTTCLDWSQFGGGNAQALLMLLCPLGKIVGPIEALKIAPVELYGFLAIALFWFLSRTLGLGVEESVFVTGFVLLQAATLRISWDLQRNILGLAFLLLLITNFKLQPTRGRMLTVGLLSILVIASHEIVGVLMILLAVALFAARLFRNELARAKILIPTLVFAFAPILLYSVPVTEPILINYPQPHSVLLVTQEHFFGVLFLPLLPLAALGIRKVNDAILAWLGIIALVSFSPLLPLPVAPAFWDRWMLMLVFPLGILAGTGALKLSEWVHHLSARLSMKRLEVAVGPAILLALILPFSVTAYGFMSAPSNHPFVLYNDPALWQAGWSGMPATMQSNTVALDMVPDVQRAMVWLNNQMNSNHVLLANYEFYGYALLYLAPTDVIIQYGYEKLTTALYSAKSQGFQNAYLIWFVPDSGWHQPDPDLTSFKLTYQSGIICVYETQLT